MLEKEGHENGVDWATLGNVSEALEGGLKRKKELHRGILHGLLLDAFKLNPLVDEVCIPKTVKTRRKFVDSLHNREQKDLHI